LADLKTAISRGLPVIAWTATTSNAHALYVVPKVCAAAKKVELAGPTRASGSLGEMISFAEGQKLRDAGCIAGLNDSVITVPRLVIGYDDAQGVLYVHDPSHGPALEWRYQDFERAWELLGRRYDYLRPKDASQRPAPVASEARGRTADEEAAVALFEGYALAVSGDHSAAVDELRRGLAIPGISPGRQHLLRLEVATALLALGRLPEAIAEMRRANKAFDEYWLSHRLLARMLSQAGEGEARAEEQTAKKLCSPEAYRRVAAELARDFPVMGCRYERLGWLRSFPEQAQQETFTAPREPER
jgi:tetratricopeptide (TPR) repeat protein